MLDDPYGAEKGEKSQVGIGDDIDEDRRYPREEHSGMFFAGNAFNKIQQSFYDCLCHRLPLAGNKFHLTSEDKG